MAKIKAEPGISVGGRRTKSLGERPQQSESGRRGTETKEWVDFIVPGGNSLESGWELLKYFLMTGQKYRVVIYSNKTNAETRLK